MKYIIGEFYYLRKDHKPLQRNERVEIVGRKKVGKRTYVDVKNIDNIVVKGISSGELNARPR